MPVAELVSLEEADAREDKLVVVADDVEIEPADDPFLEEEHGGRSGCARPRSLSAVRGRQRDFSAIVSGLSVGPAWCHSVWGLDADQQGVASANY